MQLIKFPYGDKFLQLEITDEADVLMPTLAPGVPDEVAAIRKAMAKPIRSERLAKLAQGKRSAAIVVNDITRPAPTESMLTAIMEELTEAGMEAANVTVIVAVGNHEMPTPEELEEITGCWRSKLNVIAHNCYDESSVTFVGETHRHLPVYVNSHYAKRNLKSPPA